MSHLDYLSRKLKLKIHYQSQLNHLHHLMGASFLLPGVPRIINFADSLNKVKVMRSLYISAKSLAKKYRSRVVITASGKRSLIFNEMLFTFPL